MHDHGNEQNFFDRLDLKPSSKDTINLNLGFTRSWFQTPNSFDSQNATAWSGLVVDNGGLGPNGQAGGRDGSGFEDQDVQYRADVDAFGERQLRCSRSAGFARQDQFNYYPSADPFADLIPGSSNQHHRPESQADQPGPSRQRIDREREYTTSRWELHGRTRF